MRSLSAPWHMGGNGATNFTRGEAQAFARNLLQSEAYKNKLEERIKLGTLPPAIEALLWHYAFGKPIEQVNVNVTQGQEDLSSLSVDELLSRAKEVAKQLEEARSVNEALPAQYRVA